MGIICEKSELRPPASILAFPSQRGTVVPGIRWLIGIWKYTEGEASPGEAEYETKDRSNSTRRVGPGMTLFLPLFGINGSYALRSRGFSSCWFSTLSLFLLSVYSECAVRILGFRRIGAFPASTLIETRAAWSS